MRTFMTALVLGTMLLFPTSLPAQEDGRVCATNTYDREAVIANLHKKHGEHLAGRGVDANGRLVELLTNEDTGTFTLLTTNFDMNGVLNGFKRVQRPAAE